MRIQNRCVSILEKRTYSNLEKLRLHLDKSHQDWADSLALSQTEYKKHYLNSCWNLPFKSLVNICDLYKIDSEAVSTSRFDAWAAAEHFHENYGHLPERYTIAKFSKRRTMLNILRHIEDAFGTHVSVRIMRYLQLTPQILHAIDANTNVLMAVDILETIKRTLPNDDYIFTLGRNSVVQTKNSPISTALASCRSVEEIYEKFLDQEVRYHEKNHFYRYELTRQSQIIVESKQSAEVGELLKNPLYGSDEVCTFKAGVISAIPQYIGGQNLPVKKLTCIHHGHATCRWLVNTEQNPKLKLLA